MSSRRGKGGQKKGPPSHQNKVAWVPNRATKKNENEPGSKSRPLSAICAVCPRCRDQIAWRRAYGKYKMLKEPAKCASCSRRNVKDSYHAICRECASKQKVCAKCRRPSATIIQDEDAIREAEMAELEKALKNMRERDRRTLLREMSKGEATTKELIVQAHAKARKEGDEDDEDWSDSEEEDQEEEEEDDEVHEEEDGHNGSDSGDVTKEGSSPASSEVDEEVVGGEARKDTS